MAQKPSIPQGTRDFGPKEVQRRKYILQIIESVFKKSGFMPLETPSMENLSTLTGKYGDEGDQLLFKILNSGDYFKKLIEYNEKALGHEELDPTYLPSFSGKVSDLDSKRSLSFIAEKGLRYDLTVPFARYVVMNRNQISFPFKRYQMQPVWRADRPQKGRYREFWQCDADVVGSNSLLNEAELIRMYDEAFALLGIPVVIKMNNRKFLTALAEACGAPELIGAITVAIDKLDKIGIEKVEEELKEKGLTSNQIKKIKAYLLLPKSTNSLKDLGEICGNNEAFQKGLEEVNAILDFTGCDLNNQVELDFSLARGLSYYTGAIFEVVAISGTLKSSIGGGGRYDNLTGIFGLPDVSGVGISFGLDRIYDVMEEAKLFPETIRNSPTKIIFCHFDEKGRKFAYDTCLKIRKENICAEVFPDITKKIGKQLDYANSLGIPYVAIIGDDEMREQIFSLKNLETGIQQKLSLEELINTIQS